MALTLGACVGEKTSPVAPTPSAISDPAGAIASSADESQQVSPALDRTEIPNAAGDFAFESGTHGSDKVQNEGDVGSPHQSGITVELRVAEAPEPFKRPQSGCVSSNADSFLGCGREDINLIDSQLTRTDSRENYENPEPAAPPYFSYSWRASAELTGESQFPTPVARPVLVLDGESTTTLVTSAALRLSAIHNIDLVDDEEPWDDFTAAMLLEMVRRLVDASPNSGDNSSWRVSLTREALPNDVEIIPYTEESAVRRARFTQDAFTRSNPTLQPSADGNSDRVFYSNRLFKTVLRAFFNERYLLEDILQHRYGVAVGLGEPQDEFQEFTLNELQHVLAVLEDLPAGFRNMPGLEKIVRRKNGLTNPTYPSAPAIAWVDQGFIEFMDFAFTSGSEEYIRKLVAHELAHFLWHKVLTEKTQREFMALSGWTRTPSLDSVTASLSVAEDHPKTGHGVEDSET